MKMQEFVDKYCADIKSLYSNTNDILDDGLSLPYDDIIEDDSGQKMKVVWSGETPIPINDIITSDRADFIRVYPDFDCRELYDSYMNALIIMDGEEAVKKIRNEILRERERVNKFRQRDELSDMLC